MNKILRYSFVALLAMFGLSSANATSIVFADLNLENGVQYSDPFDAGDFTVTFAGGQNDGKYYNTGTGIRVYGNGTMTIAAKSGSLTQIVVTYDGTNKPTDGDVVNVGTYNAETGTWTGSAESVVFTRPSGSGHWRIQKVEATVTGGTPSTKTATTISFSDGYETRATCGKDESVSLPTATVKAGEAAVEGATVTWESSNIEIATVNGNKLNIANGTQGEVTIKASYAGNDTYEASTKSYKLTVYKGAMLLSSMVEDVTNSNEKWDNGGELVSYWFVDKNLQSVTNTVTFAKGQNIYLTDGTNNLLFYGTNSLNLKQGDVISGDLGDGKMGAVWGKLYRYNKLPEFSFTEMNVKVQSEGATVTPKTITPDKMGENINAYVEIKDAEYVSKDNQNLTFKVGETEFIVRQNWTDVAIDGLEANAKYTILGMGAVYKTTNQLYLISYEKTGDATGINTVKAAQQNGAIYNVAGQMVTPSYKGLVIKNGKKMIQK